ncbi:MAG: hypothetical protein RL375_3836 [Pseudomonadota bacterium]|jgi:hypothetical protein
MSDFWLSQALIAVAIVFDLLSFQFKQRARILACLVVAGILITSHFVLLERWTAAGLMVIATTRFFVGIFSTATALKFVFAAAALAVGVATYAGIASILSCTGSLIQTFGAFSADDKRLRQLMMLGTGFWLCHNALVGSPAAVLMEVLFLSSNVVGYYRHYIRPARPP